MALYADSSTYSPADLDRKRKLAEALMGSDFQSVNPLGALAKTIQGGLGGFENSQAGQIENQNRQSFNTQLADLLSQPDQTLAQLSQTAGNPWASPSQQSLIAGLMGKELDGPPVAEPYTLGEGQTRYSGDNKVLAQGIPSSPDTVINNVGGSDDFYTALDKALGTSAVAAMDAGAVAQGNNIKLGQLETLLQTAPQGAQGVLTQFAGSMGIPLEGLDDLQAAQAIINQLVPGQRVPGSGTMSDADLALFKASLPQIINQPGGNAKILATIRAVNDYTIAQAEIANRIANREISPAEGRKMQRAVPNPLDNIEGVDEPPAATEETIAVNPTTGEKLKLVNGQWVPF